MFERKRLGRDLLLLAEEDLERTLREVPDTAGLPLEDDVDRAVVVDGIGHVGVLHDVFDVETCGQLAFSEDEYIGVTGWVGAEIAEHVAKKGAGRAMP